MKEAKQSVQCFGRKKNAVAVAHCAKGKGIVRVNGFPISLITPQTLNLKAIEPILVLGKERFANLDVRIRVNGGGRVAQCYAIRQAIARGVVSYYQKCINSHICNHFNIDVNEQEKRDIKDALVTYDRSLLVSDPRRCEPKKFGGPAARARKQKSYR